MKVLLGAFADGQIRMHKQSVQAWDRCVFSVSFLPSCSCWIRSPFTCMRDQRELSCKPGLTLGFSQSQDDAIARTDLRRELGRPLPSRAVHRPCLPLVLFSSPRRALFPASHPSFCQLSLSCRPACCLHEPLYPRISFSCGSGCLSRKRRCFRTLADVKREVYAQPELGVWEKRKSTAAVPKSGAPLPRGSPSLLSYPPRSPQLHRPTMQAPTGGRAPSRSGYRPRQSNYLRISATAVLQMIMYLEPAHVEWMNVSPSGCFAAPLDRACTGGASLSSAHS